MEYFVQEDSIVRKIWGKSDTILFIFAGSAAEFALNKAVDWLYFTGKLPADPIGRLFSTVSYARGIIFSDMEEAHRTIDKITSIHSAIENTRGAQIPDWAYRDVLFMLIHYSIAAYELLERKLTDSEKEDLYNVFYRLGLRMRLTDLPLDYQSWLPVRESHMNNDLQRTSYTDDLFQQYKKHLGPIRYRILIQAQKLVVPSKVRSLLSFGRFSWLSPVVPIYKMSRVFRLDKAIKSVLLPSAYHKQINDLDVVI
jgi:hypothetical protein